ncbi:MAG: adenylate kinase [Candidatus Neptunochlamydia sp.]|nr:adenylate kinase [Candidatus Neptunochlamydia sp.]
MLMLTPVFAMASLLMPLLGAQKQSRQTVVLILLGPPGAGKGTQAGLLSETLQLPHISTGDLLRSNTKEGTELGKTAKGYMDQGRLVPDALILDMLFARVAQEDCQRGYILDGFPRTLAQAKTYGQRLGKDTKTSAINLSLSNEIIVDRLSKRLTCKECNTPYHLTFSPSKKGGICDACEGLLIQRSDDKEEVIKNRLAVYEEQTAPLIRYYSEKKNLKEFSCNQPIDKVLNEILDYLCEIYRSLQEG